MPEPTRWRGRYMDGETARSQDVVASVGGDGIAIGDGSGRNIAFWPADRVVLIDRRRETPEIRLGLEGTTARLVLADGGAPGELRRTLPGAFRRARVRRSTVLQVGGWSLLAAGGLAFVFVVLAPALSEQFAKRLPEGLRRQIGEAVLERVVAILPYVTGEPGPVRYCRGSGSAGPLERLAVRLNGGLETPLALRIAVVDSRLVNAFALPGGHVVLTGGLLKDAESADEIAGVLAHEMGHAFHLHATQGVFRAAAFSFLVGTVLGDFGGGILATTVAEATLNGAYSRSAERDADRFAVEILNRTGIDPLGLDRFLSRVAAEAAEDGHSELPRFLATHPATADRIAFVRANARADGAAMPPGDWAALQRICSAVDSGPVFVSVDAGS